MIEAPPQACILAGAEYFAGAEIVAHLAAHDWNVSATPGLDVEQVTRAFAGQPKTTALIVVLPQPLLGKAFLDVDDDDLEAAMACAIDLIAVVGAGMEALPDDGAIVVVGNRGFLGGWGGPHEMALSGAAMGFVRSAALAARPREIRVNAVALDLPTRTPVDPLSAAALSLFLASPQSRFVNAEIILANKGRSLLLREASDRR